MGLRQFLIQNQPDYPWQPGHSNDCKPILLGEYESIAVAVFIDNFGVLSNFECRDFQSKIPNIGRDKTVNTMYLWKEEIGFTGADISISQFQLPKLRIGIKILPEHLRAFVADPTFVTSRTEREDWENDIKEWHESGKFVLQWGNEYWMNEFGGVTDT